jgi:hypothetical protein
LTCQFNFAGETLLDHERETVAAIMTLGVAVTINSVLLGTHFIQEEIGLKN